MGISKNAVIGKARRLGLPAREAPANIASPKSRGMVSRPAARSNRELPTLSDTRAASPSRPRAATSSGALSSAVERRVSSLPVENLPGAVVAAPPRRVFSHKQCQYIISSADRVHRFCEAPVVENAMGRPSAFCATHFELCLVSPKKALEERKAQRAADIEAARVRWNAPSVWR
jgi:GcrA cell cycle regulator